MHNKSKLERIHKSNVKIVVVCVVMFVFIAIAKWGFTFVTVKALIGIFSGATAGILFALFGKNDLIRAVGLMASMGIGSFFYSGAVGGSAAGGLISFALIAMTARYYKKNIMFWFSIPTGISMFIAAIIAPYSVLGPRGTRLEAIFQTALFAIMAYMVEKSIKLGDGVNKQTMEVLKQIEEDAIEQGKMGQKLNATVIESNNTIEDVVSKSEDMEKAGRNISNAYNDMASAISNVNRSINDAQKYINDDIELANNLREDYENVVNIVKEGMNKVHSTKAMINTMEVVMNNTIEITNKLVLYMDKIDTILEEMNTIAAKTNLLSLNASIEAARAGEEGKGFAVVANSILILSDQSTVAAEKIKEIIEKLKNSVKDIEDRINESSEISKDGYVEMDRITEVLKTIDETSNEVELIIKEENDLVASLGEEFNSIVKNADDLYHISQNNLEELIKIEKPIEEQKLASQEISKKIADIESLSKRVAI